MRLQTFRAATMADGLLQAKKALGPDAVILHTRTFRAGGFLGLGTRPVVEITATAAQVKDRAQPSFTPPTIQPPSAARPAASKPAPAIHTPFDPARAATAQAIEPKPGRESADLEAEIRELKAMMGQVMQAARTPTASRSGPSPLGVLPEPLLELSEAMIRNDVPQDLADELIGTVRDQLSAAERDDRMITTQILLATLAERLPTRATDFAKLRGRGSPTVVALFGPTGVGKTTTVAKLAATAKLRHGLRVGLITSDTYRIAAVEQLRTYASIIGVPLQVVNTPEELAQARTALHACELIIVDTAGRSQNDSKRVGELMELVRAAKPDERHLVLSTTNSSQASMRIGERFCVLRPDRLILTKLDEAVETGVVAALPRALGIPLSFVTSGQEVPDDLESAASDRLAKLVLHGPTGRPDDPDPASRLRQQAASSHEGVTIGRNLQGNGTSSSTRVQPNGTGASS